MNMQPVEGILTLTQELYLNLLGQPVKAAQAKSENGFK